VELKPGLLRELIEQLQRAAEALDRRNSGRILH